MMICIGIDGERNSIMSACHLSDELNFTRDQK